MSDTIQIHENTRIYIMCPPRIASGGPELLHQLAYKLGKRGFDVAMYYYPNNVEQPVSENYLKYNCKYVTEVEDREENLVIIPELYFYFADQFKKIRKCAWWLSVDNLFKAIEAPKHYRMIRKLKIKWLHRAVTLNGKVRGKFSYHLAQSEYALDFLRQWKIDAIYLSDYLNADFLKASREVDLSVKKPQILYNPLKGFRFTKKIMAAMPEAKWIPLQKLTPAQVGDLLKESMVYIDFGHHPGKDRFPREAAIYKCCVITGKRGSAAFREDVPLPEQYKIADRRSNIPEIVKMINSCVTDYDKHIGDFAAYREWIYKEEEEFEKDITRIFVKS